MLYSFDFPNLITDDEIDELSGYANYLYKNGHFTNLDEIDDKIGSGVFFLDEHQWNKQKTNINVSMSTITNQLPDHIHNFLVNLEGRYNSKGSYFSMVNPHEIVTPHIDDNWRKCNMMIPLTLLHAPIIYYNESGEVEETVHFNRPILSNTTVSHGVVNNGLRRLTYQISFYNDIETVLGVLNGV